MASPKMDELKFVLVSVVDLWSYWGNDCICSFCFVFYYREHL